MQWEDPLDPHKLESTNTFVNGKCRKTMRLMGPDGITRDYYTEFDGHSVHEMNDANIRYIAVNKKSLRYKMTQPLVNLLEWTITKLEQFQRDNKVHVLSDAERIDLAFPQKLDEVEITLPSNERLYIWASKYKHNRFIGWIINKYLDREWKKIQREHLENDLVTTANANTYGKDQYKQNPPGHDMYFEEYGPSGHVLMPELPEGFEYHSMGELDLDHDYIADYLKENEDN